MNSLKAILALGLYSLFAPAADLPNAAILAPRDAPEPEQKSARMLSEEVAWRTQIRLEVLHAAPAGNRPLIARGTASELGARAGLPPVVAADGIEIHPLLSRPVPFKPLEFDIPRQATVNGELHLKPVWAMPVADCWRLRYR
jgi:hypothetical protein